MNLARAQKMSEIFITWIETYGTRKLSEELQVSTSSVEKWKRGHLPRPWIMTRIREISKGEIDYHHMVEGSQYGVNR